jgi:ferredoxin
METDETLVEIKVNRDTCHGYGNCVLVAEELFDLDDDGIVVVKRNADAAQLGALRRAVYDCPTNSISFDEPAPPG